MGTKKQQSLPNGRRYSPEEKEQAVRLVRTLPDELGTSHGTVQRVLDSSATASRACADGSNKPTSIMGSSVGPRRRTRSGSPSSRRRSVS